MAFTSQRMSKSWVVILYIDQIIMFLSPFVPNVIMLLTLNNSAVLSG